MIKDKTKFSAVTHTPLALAGVGAGAVAGAAVAVQQDSYAGGLARHLAPLGAVWLPAVRSVCGGAGKALFGWVPLRLVDLNPSKRADWLACARAVGLQGVPWKKVAYIVSRLPHDWPSGCWAGIGPRPPFNPPDCPLAAVDLASRTLEGPLYGMAYGATFCLIGAALGMLISRNPQVVAALRIPEDLPDLFCCAPGLARPLKPVVRFLNAYGTLAARVSGVAPQQQPPAPPAEGDALQAPLVVAAPDVP